MTAVERQMRHSGTWTAALGSAYLALVFCGFASAAWGHARPQPSVEAPQSDDPCAIYTQDETRSRTEALLECQKKSVPATPPHLTSDEAAKIYDAYISGISTPPGEKDQ